MAIFNSYVSLPEGNQCCWMVDPPDDPLPSPPIPSHRPHRQRISRGPSPAERRLQASCWTAGIASA